MLTFCSIDGYFRSKYVCFGSRGNIFMFAYFFRFESGKRYRVHEKERREKREND